MAKLISVVTTFRNEETILEEFLSRVRSVFSQLKYDYELVFVDDDSSDSSSDIIKRHAREDNRIKLLVTSRRFGVYPCLIAGLSHAAGDAVIYLETDLQDPPELIPTLIEKWEAGADVVFTTRTKRPKEGRPKMLLTWLAYRVINLFSDVPVPVDSGDYKLLSKHVVDEVLTLTEHEPYFRGMVSWVGFKQAQVFYRREPRFSGKSRRGLWTLAPVKVFLSALLSCSNKPLYFAALTGLALFATGLILVLFAVFGNITTSSRAFFLLLILTISFVHLALAIHSLYLVRIYEEARKRPLYLVKEKVGFGGRKTQISFRNE